jgi:phospholipase C
VGLTEFVERDPFIEQIFNARFKELPTGFHALSEEELKQLRNNPSHPALPRQEPGTKPSCPLPYELAVDGQLDQDRKNFVIRFEARQDLFGDRSAGAPFLVYAQTAAGLTARNYAVKPGSFVEGAWPLKDFDQGRYAIRVYGPNGFFREFHGSAGEPQVSISLDANLQAGAQTAAPCKQVDVMIENHDPSAPAAVVVKDQAYGNAALQCTLKPGEKRRLPVNVEQSAGWYDIRIALQADPQFEKCYAGRVESGHWGTSDPAMGARHS